MTSRARTIAGFGDGIATADIDDGAATTPDELKAVRPAALETQE